MKNRQKKFVAIFFLLALGAELLLPATAYALTSGPAQPEMQKFQPAGNANLVDLFTGDMNYSIPLLDVGGYPVNLAYQSGTSMEEDASWVGMGWVLNPGAVTRNMRGLPDDFDGTGENGDKIVKEYSRKEFRKIGGSVIFKPAILSWEFGQASLKLNVYKDNYYGIGASVGAGVSFSLAKNSSTPLTAGLDITSDTRDGVTIAPNLSVSVSGQDKQEDDYVSGSLSGSLKYNSRSGLKETSLGVSFSTVIKDKDQWRSGLGSWDASATHYFGQSYTPSLTNNTRNNGLTFNFDLGLSLVGLYLGLGGSGYVYKENLLDPVSSAPAFGYLNYLKGRNDKAALLDFNREKDGVFLRDAPAIATPVATQDFFMVTGQAGSAQYRPYYSGNYIVSDKQFSNKSGNTSGGVTFGWTFNSLQLGARIEHTEGEARTRKWTDNNNYLTAADYQLTGQPDEEPVYFKQVGEKTAFDVNFLSQTGGTETRKVGIGVARSNSTQSSFTRPVLQARAPVAPVAVTQPIRKQQRDIKNQPFAWLNAKQADKYALDKQIKNYTTAGLLTYTTEARYDAVRKEHHISEFTQTDNSGSRMVYGIPVYNKEQQEITFSVDPASNYAEARRTGLVTYTGDPASNHNFGRDHLYSNTKTPGYATSYLLTGILSPDYVDLKGDGITDDDPGTAVKFNYTRTQSNYKWRAPYAAGKANYNEGFLTDTKDDKASIVYGEKEIWYTHSIESKTMIAFFETSNREDGLGVLNRNGGQNTSATLKKLDRIKLYSKADWLKNGTDAVPIKVVHFEYDYSLYEDVPNNSGNPVKKDGTAVDPGDEDDPAINVNIKKGKLTLKKVYFTFGTSSRGESNPYEFSYDMRMINTIPDLPANSYTREAADQYAERQSDRWGTYKQSFYNVVSSGTPLFNNSEFPYTIQENSSTDYSEQTLVDRFASKWQLNEIITPTGSIIKVEYESDDYGFVQNRRAMQMCMLEGYGPSNPKGLIDASQLTAKLPRAVLNKQDFIRSYLSETNGDIMKKMFFRAYVNVDNKGHYEYVSGYADIDVPALSALSSSLFANVTSVPIPIKPLNGSNAISKAAWQMLYADLPQHAYDNYDNSDVGDGVAAIKSIITALGNLGEFTKSPDERARNRKFASVMDPSKSMVRLYSPDLKKLGGGLRVKKVTISDEWDEMAGNGNKKSVTGQYYDYTTTDTRGKTISSGVASYEPAAGNEENPFHEPVSFTENVQWSSDRYHYIEKPFCETYFPAAMVGYSKVTIYSFGNDYTGEGKPTNHTGYIENEFYTAKEFPTLVDNLVLDMLPTESSLILKLFAARAITKVVTSQGFKVELNDMHGKQKGVKVYNKAGDKISSASYQYQVKDERAELKQLDNRVDVLDRDGQIRSAVSVATDVDFVTDMRESISETIGGSVGVYFGVISFIIVNLGHFGLMANVSETMDQYHSTSAVKVIQRYGILKKTITTQNGSTIEAENLLWDGLTGEVLLTKTQTEYDKYTYAFSYPAYMVGEYEGMGAAYRNLGVTFTSFVTDADGAITSLSSLNQLKYLFPGDELVALNETKKGWIIRSDDDSYRLIDEDGNFMSVSGAWRIIRSGRRNLLAAGTGSVVTMKDPRVGGEIVLDVDKRILDSKAIAYKDEWSIPVNDSSHIQASVGNIDTCEGFKVARLIFQYFLQPFSPSPDPHPLRELMFSDQSASQTMYSVIDAFHASPFSYSYPTLASETFYGDLLNQVSYFVNHPRYNVIGGQNNYYFNASDTVTLGGYRMVFESIDPLFNQMVNFDPPSNLCEPPAIISAYTDPVDNFCYYNVSLYLDTSMLSRGKTFKPGNQRTGSSLVRRKENKYYLENQNGAETQRVSTCVEQEIAVIKIFKEDHLLVCDTPVNTIVNPYYKGVLGNWRPYINYVYTVSREQKPGNPSQTGGTDIRNSGYYSVYSPFWAWQSGILGRTVADDESFSLSNPLSRWIWSNKSVYYDQKGNEVESVDALNRYGAALFGYQQSLAIAVGANARRNEIAFDGFEDYYFDISNGTQEGICPLQRHLDFGLVKQDDDWISGSGQLVSEEAHSGRYSYRINSAVTITRAGGSASPSSPVLDYDASGRYLLKANELALGFAPIESKDYLVSLWVKDNTPIQNTISNLAVSVKEKVSGTDVTTTVPVSSTIIPVVEGWKRLEFKFKAAADFQLTLTPSGTLYLDDIRILPDAGQMNSYVYDDRTLRLVAQLDENNFATFYEYDEEGTPVRVKKETEKGILTLKESRQSFRKHQ